MHMLLLVLLPITLRRYKVHYSHLIHIGWYAMLRNHPRIPNAIWIALSMLLVARPAPLLPEDAACQRDPHLDADHRSGLPAPHHAPGREMTLTLPPHRLVRSTIRPVT